MPSSQGANFVYKWVSFLSRVLNWLLAWGLEKSLGFISACVSDLFLALPAACRAHGVSLCAARPSQRSASSPHVTPGEIRRCPLKGLCVCCCLHAPASGTKGVYISPPVFMLLEQLPAQHIWSLDSGFQVTEYFQRTDN